MALPSSEVLRQALERALNTAERVVERLAPSGYIDPSDPTNVVTSAKVVGETATLLLVANGVRSDVQVLNRVASLARALIPHARSRACIARICLEPSQALDHGFAHVCLSRLGYPDMRFDEIMRRSASAPGSRGRERVPHRHLEQLWIRSLCEDSDGRIGPRAHRQRVASAVDEPIDLFGASTEDLYALTHAIMYLTAMGCEPRRLRHRQRRLFADVEAALARCLDRQDYDLAGELVLAWPLTATPWSATSAFALEVLDELTRRVGFLPTPGTRLARLESLRGEPRDAYVLATTYHATYVMGIVASIALARDLPSRGRGGRGRVVENSAATLLRVLERLGSPSHWQIRFGELTADRQNALAPMLLDIALFRAIRCGNPEQARIALGIGYRLGLADRPAAGQAAHLLHRLQMLAPCDPTVDGALANTHRDSIRRAGIARPRCRAR